MTESDNNRSGPAHCPPMHSRVAAGLLVAGLVLAGCGDDDAVQADPEAALSAWVEGINAKSVDDVMDAFAEDSRLIDHPQYPGVSTGKTEIRFGVSSTVTNTQATSDSPAYTISNVVVDGDTVSWSYLWKRNNGDEYCATGNEIDVNDGGLIVELRWSDNADECNE